MKRILLVFALAFTLLAGFALAEEPLSAPLSDYVPEPDQYIPLDKVDPAGRTLIPAADGSVSIADPETSAFRVPDEFEPCSEAALIDLIARAGADFVTTPLETDYSYWLVRSNPEEAGGSTINSFSLYVPTLSPNLQDSHITQPAQAMDDNLYVLNFLQSYEIRGLSKDQPVNVAKLNEFFGKKWLRLNEFAFGRRFFCTSDGVSCYITPVYYADESGVFEDRIYLSVFMYAEGYDEDYLSSLDVTLNEEELSYNPCRAEYMLIADQQIVAEMLQLMLAGTDLDAVAADTSQYRVLAKGSSGDDVKALQQKLIELGYLADGADGIFGNMSRDAVSAYQQAMGLEVTGKAGVKMQHTLFFNRGAWEQLLALLESCS